MPSRPCRTGRIRGMRPEAGFTLIELLVVMIIIGILAAIAIPVFLNQRAKARDTATKSDVSRLGKEVAAFYVDGVGGLTVTATGITATAKSGGTTVFTLTLTNGSIVPPSMATNDFKATSGSESTTWCVSLRNDNGAVKDYSFSAASGLQPGLCP